MSKVKNELKNDPLMPLRHSAEHVLHTAMQELYPQLKKVMGPPIEDGFYFDFDLEQKIIPDDFPKIEAQMREIIKANLPITRKEVSAAEAEKLFQKNQYKLNTLEEIKQRGERVSLYEIGKKGDKHYEVDLCSGPHVKSTGEVKAFKLLSVAGAYYKGDEKNKMLTRIYGTAFLNEKELDKYLKILEEAKKRDHRKIGKELDLFVFSDLVGKGLPMFTVKGATIRRILERFIVDEEIKRGYQHVITPPLAKVDLYRTSGHYPYYKDTMYPPMVVDEEELILRPMTCPHHFMMYKAEPRSYRELPYRLAEISPQFRYEKSGELTGLMRVRMFCLADAHIMTQVEKAKDEIKSVLDLIDYVNQILGMKKGSDYRYRLSLGDRHDSKKYYKDDKAWDYAENVLREVLTETDSPYFEASGEAAFYGPKIDVQITNVSGKEETAFTVQYDFVMPKRFQLSYIDVDGKEKQPIVIHRSSIGAFERTMAFLIEKYAGAFPVWLSPIQVIIVPISQNHAKYAQEIAQQLQKSEIRVEIDDRAETMQARIRDAQMKKIPYMMILGDREVEKQQVSVRLRSGKQLNNLKVEELKERILKENGEKKDL